jgi:hypothetical protein
MKTKYVTAGTHRHRKKLKKYWKILSSGRKV